MNPTTTSDAARRRTITNPGGREFHGYAGPAPIFLGDHIHVDRFAAAADTPERTFVRVNHGGVESDAVHVGRAELLAAARAILSHYGYHPNPAGAREIRLVREASGTVSGYADGDRVGAVWGPGVGGDWYAGINVAGGERDVSAHETYRDAMVRLFRTMGLYDPPPAGGST